MTDAQQKPSLGRIVRYGVQTVAGALEVRPAIITRVHNDTCVDLEVFGVHDNRLPTSVVQGDGERQWNWPPRG